MSPKQPIVSLPDCIDQATYASLERLARQKDIDIELLVAQILDRYLLREKGSLN